ncbi:MAG: hypothetical protein J1F35_05155 [Erysipelotrichales bacterium]|nr:hypothetical protein [Erysipelotrichales bacterium]
MRIGIDIDDTMTDSYDDIMSAYSKFYNLDKTQLIHNKTSYEELCDKNKYPDYRKFAIGNFESIIPNVKLKKDVKEVIDALHKMGYTIEIVTARTLTEYDDPWGISYDYLKKNDIYYDKLNIGVYDKGIFCKEHNIDILIDDSIKNLNNAKAHGIKTILFGNIFNEDNQEFIRANSWLEILHMLSNNVTN